MKPISVINLYFEVIDGKKLIIVDVSVGKDIPYYYVSDKTIETHILVGNESVVVSATELKSL